MRFAFVIFFFLTILSSCNHLRDIELYQTISSVDQIEAFDFKEIFTDSKKTKLWGVKMNDCKEVVFDSSNNFEGEDHLYVKWDKNGKCKFIGIGFTWGGYKSKNLSPLINSAAIEMMIRIDEGEKTKLPMFFSLVDYSGKMCVSKINYLDIDGGVISQNWTKVRIPLQAFNYEKKGVNMSNIKELRIEFQQSGSVHIDDMKIVRHEHNYIKTDTNFKSSYNSFPIKIGIGSEYWWGVNSKYSTNFKFAPSSSSGQSESLIANVDLSIKNSWNNFGFAFDQWNHVDISEIYSTSALNFKIKSSTLPKLQIMIVSYKGEKRRIQRLIDESNYKEVEKGVYEVLIPIKSFDDYQLLDWKSLKEIRVTVKESSQFEIGEFQILEFRGNPKNPQKWIGK